MTNTIDHVLLVGPPGFGKIQWARAQNEFTPLSRDCDPDMPYIYRTAGLSDNDHPSPSAIKPPFRAPHHTCSIAGIMGSIQRSYQWRPGEVSLAHGGVLFLDELQEFRRSTLEALDQVVRDGFVLLPGSQTKFPARFRLIASVTECPCGWVGQTLKECRCTEKSRSDYAARVPQWLRTIARVVRRDEYQYQAQNQGLAL